jgi:uncharacterized RDD family membrane protein YckC
MTDQPGPLDPQQPGTPPDPYAAPAPGAGQAPPPPPPPPAPSAPPAPSYGTPPPPPSYGTPPPAPGYGQMPPAGYPAQPSGPPFATWGNRVVGALIDYFIPGIIAGVIYQGSHGLGAILYLVVLGWAIYNKVLEGQTGQSTGKKVAGTKLVLAATGQPVGVGLAIGRYFLHIIDGLPCYLGFLWPLWDAKRQTFADKILNTYVVKV